MWHRPRYLPLARPHSRLTLVVPVLLAITLVWLALYLLWRATAEPTVPSTFDNAFSRERP